MNLPSAPLARPRVLVVDDHLEMAKVISEDLNEAGYDAVPLALGREALAALERDDVDAVVTDLRIPDVDGLQLLAASRKLRPERPVIIMTAYGAVDSAIESIRQGAYHYVTKPLKTDELRLFLDRALEARKVRLEAESLRTQVKQRFSFSGLIARSQPMVAVLDVLRRVCDSTVPVLLTGETGTGKGALAHAVHTEGARAARPFVSVNCAAIPEALLESELFGHRRGAFTGAVADRQGLFVEANGGTLFLDEIGDMPLGLQAKLLHVLERRVVRPVGAEKEVPLDLRLITATNRDLRAAVHQGSFREDLLYRLDVVAVEVPPLRRRLDDLPLLLELFLRRAKERHPHSPVDTFAAPAVDRLLAHGWPGNVRELEHVVERVVVLGRAAEVSVNDLPKWPPPSATAGSLDFGRTVLPVRELQRRYAAWALAQLGGHRGRTAEALGIDAKTLAKWLAEHEERTAAVVVQPRS